MDHMTTLDLDCCQSKMINYTGQFILIVCVFYQPSCSHENLHSLSDICPAPYVSFFMYLQIIPYCIHTIAGNRLNCVCIIYEQYKLWFLCDWILRKMIKFILIPMASMGTALLDWPGNQEREEFHSLCVTRWYITKCWNLLWCVTI